MIVYRKTKTGEWVVYGPTSELISEQLDRHYTTVRVTTRDGATKTAYVSRVGQPFTVDGVEMAYGYLDDPRNGPARRTADEARARRDGDPTWWE